MAVIRVNKSTDYTVMSNNHFREKTMSLKAKGLLSLMLSLPDNWDYSIAGLVAICKESEKAIKTTLAELKEFGYLIITKKYPNETKTGRIEYTFNIYEQPQIKQEVQNQGVQKQEVQNQGVQKQEVQNQPLEKEGQLNNNNQITKDKDKNNKIYKNIIDYLNLKAGTSYRVASKDTQKHINARIKEGYTVEDFKTVIDKKCAEWKGTEFEQYLRPATLFGSKFENYLNAKTQMKTDKNSGWHFNAQADDPLPF